MAKGSQKREIDLVPMQSSKDVWPVLFSVQRPAGQVMQVGCAFTFW